MSDPSPDRLDALLAELKSQLDESSAGMRVTSEWKQIRDVVGEHDAERDAIAADPDRLDGAIRVLEAQRDMLALTREEVAEQDRLAERERVRREAEDRKIVEIVQAWLPPYSGMAVGGLVLAPVIGWVFGEWCLIAAFLPVLGFLEMRRRTSLMEGRSWVILNDPVRELEARVRIYHVISGVAVAVAVAWFVGALLTGEAV